MDTQITVHTTDLRVWMNCATVSGNVVLESLEKPFDPLIVADISDH